MNLDERGGAMQGFERVREKGEHERLLCKKKLETNKRVGSSHKGCFWRKGSSKAGVGKPDGRTSGRAAGKQTTQKKRKQKWQVSFWTFRVDTEAKQQEKRKR